MAFCPSGHLPLTDDSSGKHILCHKIATVPAAAACPQPIGPFPLSFRMPRGHCKRQFALTVITASD
jgi:hypothetical protein